MDGPLQSFCHRFLPVSFAPENGHVLAMNENLYALLRSRFPKDPAAPCFLIPGGRDVSYGELIGGAGRLAALMRQRGVGAGDRIVVQAPKSPEMVMLYLATLQIGAIFTP